MCKQRILKAAAFLFGFSTSPLLFIGTYPGSLSEAACPQHFLKLQRPAPSRPPSVSQSR
jgi:hypothetical protein